MKLKCIGLCMSGQGFKAYERWVGVRSCVGATMDTTRRDSGQFKKWALLRSPFGRYRAQGWAPGRVFPGTQRTRMPDPGPRTTRIGQGSPGLPETRVPGWPSTKNALDEAERERKRKGKEEKERMSE